MRGAIAITGTGATTSAGLTAALEALPPPIRARAARAEVISQLALTAAATALADAGVAVAETEPRADVGVALGTGFGCFLTNAAFQRRLAAGGVASASPRLFAATVSNAAAGELGIAWGLGGPAVTLSAGGASGLAAIGHAAEVVRGGAARAMVAGGMDAVDVALDGWLGDGGLPCDGRTASAAAVLVLEAAGAARDRGARIAGDLLGHALGFTPTDARVLAAVATRALSGADVRPGDVGLVVSGTGGGRQALVADALAATFGAAVPPMSRADRHGETFAAAGPLGLLAALAEARSAAPILVVDACPSGHVAALVVRPGGGA